MSLEKGTIQSIWVILSDLKDIFISYIHRADIAENQTQNLILWVVKFITNWITNLVGIFY